MAAIRSGLLAALVALPLAAPVTAYTPNSPEVVTLIDQGIAAIDKVTDDRLGGKCLLGLVHLKRGNTKHPRVAEALSECKKLQTSAREQDVYSNGLAIIFLCELPGNNGDTLSAYTGALMARQKPHGGWGYDARQTGDTSQTQYAALAMWSLHTHGHRIDAEGLQNLAKWLMRTQDLDGGWGYQGELPEDGGDQLIKQTEITGTMVSAAMGSLLICADLFGMLQIGANDVPAAGPEGNSAEGAANSGLPAALRIAGSAPAARRGGPISPGSVNREELFATLKRGEAWVQKNYSIRASAYGSYFLYALERHKSFQEVLEGTAQPEPRWYNEGVELLKETQAKGDGTWQSGCGVAVDTAFSVLFLMRSTQMMLNDSLTAGSLLSGRGLPRNLATATMRDGKIVADVSKVAISELMGLMDDEATERIGELAEDPHTLVTGELKPEDSQRIEQLARGGKANVRLLAVRTLGRSGNLDHAPTLIYALSDPDRRVVLAARDGLVFLSCRFPGYGPSDEYTDAERFEAIDRWSQWLRTIRPDVVIPLK